MEPGYQDKLTRVERLALFVEHKWSMGHAAWAVVYFLAALVLLPAVLIHSAGTGVVIWAYLTEGFYGAGGYTPATTLAINVFCTVLGFFVCCWWCLVVRLLCCHLRWLPYRASGGLLTAGAVLQAELSLLTIALLIVGQGACIYTAAVPVALMLLIGYLCRLKRGHRQGKRIRQ